MVAIEAIAPIIASIQYQKVSFFLAVLVICLIGMLILERSNDDDWFTCPIELSINAMENLCSGRMNNSLLTVRPSARPEIVFGVMRCRCHCVLFACYRKFFVCSLRRRTHLSLCGWWNVIVKIYATQKIYYNALQICEVLLTD